MRLNLILIRLNSKANALLNVKKYMTTFILLNVGFSIVFLIFAVCQYQKCETLGFEIIEKHLIAKDNDTNRRAEIGDLNNKLNLLIEHLGLESKTEYSSYREYFVKKVPDEIKKAKRGC